LKERLRKLLQLTKGDNERISKKTGYLIIIALIGLLLLIFGNAFTSSPNETKSETEINTSIEESSQKGSTKEDAEQAPVEVLEMSYKKDLEEMLEKIKGVSEVEVMVNLDATNSKVYEKNLIKGQQTTDESDEHGGIRKVEDQTEETQVVFVREGDREIPLLVQTKKPDVRGVFVVAKGVDHATVKMWVIESVAKVLDVPTHRVSVMPRK